MVPFRRAFEIHRAPGPKIHSLLARVLASFANRVEAMAWLEPFRNRQVVYPPPAGKSASIKSVMKDIWRSTRMEDDLKLSSARCNVRLNLMVVAAIGFGLF